MAVSDEVVRISRPTRRLSIWKASLCVVLLCVVLFVFLQLTHSLTSPAPIIVSRETTFVTKPLNANGQNIDYVQLLPKRLTQSTPQNDSWTTAVLGSDARSGIKLPTDSPRIVYDHPSRLNTQTFDEAEGQDQSFDERRNKRSNQPFTAEIDPEFSALIDGNESWYRTVIDEEPGPVCVHPSDFLGIGRLSLEYVELPLMATHQELAAAFQLRAMLAIGRNEFDKVLESAQLISRCAEREAQIPFLVNEILSQELWKRAAHVSMVTMLSFDTLTDSQIDSLLSSMASRKQNRDAELLHFQRLTLLDGIQSNREIGFHIWLAPPNNGISSSQMNFVKAGPWAALRGGFGDYRRWNELNRIRIAIDCNVLMRSVNRTHDQLEQALSLTTYQKQINQIEAIRNPKKAKLDQYNQPLSQYNANELTAMAEAFVALQLRPMPELAATDKNRHRFLHIVARINRFQQATDTYPTSLDQIRSKEFGPNPEPRDFTDSFTGDQLAYRKTQQGFILSSAGKKPVDDSAKINTNEDLPELIDDFVFVWPPK